MKVSIVVKLNDVRVLFLPLSTLPSSATSEPNAPPSRADRY